MSYYRRAGSSTAPATTLCQKCLKKGHYTFECTASQQDRPYVSRPSRTQQLRNPKLAPKLTNDAPKEATQITTSDRRDVPSVENRVVDKSHRSRRSSSVSSYTSGSVSSYSSSDTKSSKRDDSRYDSRHKYSRTRSRSNDFLHSRARRDNHSNRKADSPYRSRSTKRQQPREPRRSRSPNNSRNGNIRSPGGEERSRQASRYGPSEPTDRTNTYREHSRTDSSEQDISRLTRRQQSPPPPRERSLSPYSQRVALTRSQ